MAATEAVPSLGNAAAFGLSDLLFFGPCYELYNDFNIGTGERLSGPEKAGRVLEFLPVAGRVLKGPATSVGSGVLRRGERPKAWWYRGSEADEMWRALSLRDKVFYEVGQKTMPTKEFAKYADLYVDARRRAIVDDRLDVGPHASGFRMASWRGRDAEHRAYSSGSMGRSTGCWGWCCWRCFVLRSQR